jgi:enoyl-CoA hydratase
LLVTGAGDHAFCAGADVNELFGRSPAAARAGAASGQAVFAKLDALPIPSLALVDGYPFGGGLELALACTFRDAARAAKLGLPEIRLGLIPGSGGTQRLPRLIGEARALEIILTAAPFLPMTPSGSDSSIGWLMAICSRPAKISPMR